MENYCRKDFLLYMFVRIGREREKKGRRPEQRREGAGGGSYFKLFFFFFFASSVTFAHQIWEFCLNNK